MISTGFSRCFRRATVCAAALLTTALCGSVPQAQAAGLAVISPDLSGKNSDLSAAPTNSIKKTVNGKYAVQVDNGWVVYQGFAGSTTLDFYDNSASGDFNPGPGIKLRPGQNDLSGSGSIFNAGGIVFAPCAVSPSSQCAVATNDGSPGIGLGFGQVTAGAASAEGGWVSDDTATAHLTNNDGVSGSIAALAVDPTNGAYAVGWDSDSTGSNSAVVMTLDSAGQTYAPTGQINLGTLGGATSQALGISQNAGYVVGIAETAANKEHAVFALTGATSWTDLTAGFPAGVIKSRALAASNNGLIAGSATVKRSVAGKMTSVDIGFVYNTSTSTVTFFESPGANVIPLKVLSNGEVIGNLELLSKSTVKAYHPFLYNGTSVVDYGTMTLASTGLPAYGCRVNHPNNLGEVVGTCIPSSATTYGVSAGTPFYLNAVGASPAFVDVNAAIHATSDASTPEVAPYVMGTVSSIDDEDEITVIGIKIVGGNANEAAFLASKVTYNQ